MLEYKDKVIQLLRDRGLVPHLNSLEIGLVEDMFKRGTPEHNCARIIYELRYNSF